MAPSGEDAIRAAWLAGDPRRTTEEAIRAYGPEVYGLLLSLHRSEDEADDAFSLFAERLFTKMGEFAFRCSMRTWAYLLARRASRDVRRSGYRPGTRVPLSEVSALSALVARARSETLSLFRPETVDAFARLRDELPEDDRTLLVLRVDRELEWEEVAVVFLGDEVDAAEHDIKREAARLRKRFQLVKGRLKALAEERGLVRTDE
jgi:RNA polymerase sigma-70 factor (ECF subfamily)